MEAESKLRCHFSGCHCGGLNGSGPHREIRSDTIRREDLDGGSVLLEVGFEL